MDDLKQALARIEQIHAANPYIFTEEIRKKLCVLGAQIEEYGPYFCAQYYEPYHSTWVVSMQMNHNNTNHNTNHHTNNDTNHNH